MSPPRFENRQRTRIIDLSAPRADVEGAVALFARATAYLPRTPRLGDAHGYRVFWLSGGKLRWRDVVADGRCHVVVGRHPSVHVRLDGDHAIALRHLVLRASVQSDGRVELRVLDLGAPMPLLIDASEEPAPSTAISGPLVARLGAHAVCALPHDGCRETEACGGPGAADSDDDVESSDEPEPAPADSAALVHLRSWRRDERSRTSVRTLSASTHVESLVRPGAVPWVELRLVGRLGKMGVLLAREQLDGMVLVGRYERCVSGSRQVYSDLVSRVHLGLIRTRDALDVLDLGSTNGILRDGQRVQRVAVEESSVIQLGDARERVEITVRR